MQHILIVDDDKTNLTVARTVLSSTYKITPVTSGQQALDFLGKSTCDLILLDINMPGMDGYETLEKIRELQAHRPDEGTPVIFLTADNTSDTESRCLREGAADFIVKPFVPNVMMARIARILELEDLRRDQQEKIDRQTEHIRIIQQKIVVGMASMVASRDSDTGGHILRTSSIVEIFAEELLATGRFSRHFLDMVVRAAPLHDLGKIAIDDRVLRKNGRFTDEEYAEMKRHSAEGARVVKKLLEGVEGEEFVNLAVNVAHYHHEKWNGKGYPEGLAGEDIPVEARIMALADVFDALVSKRCYKEAYDYDHAFGIIEESLGSHFDPELGELFLKCRPRLEAYCSGRLEEADGLV